MPRQSQTRGGGEPEVKAMVGPINDFMMSNDCNQLRREPLFRNLYAIGRVCIN